MQTQLQQVAVAAIWFVVIVSPFHKALANQNLIEGHGCVGNLVWIDSNQNGVKEEFETGFPTAHVTLETLDKKVIDQIQSPNGYFMLCGPAGEYQLKLRVPNGYQVTAPMATDDKFHDSNADKQGISGVSIKAAKTIGHIDIGIFSTQKKMSANGLVRAPELAPARNSDNTKINFGPWVEFRHRNEVFDKFNSALLWAPPEEIIEILNDAEKTNTALVLQLGSAGDWGWSFEKSASTFTLEKWLSSTDRFGKNKDIQQAISHAISIGTIHSIYLIDEPHHKRWSPNKDSNNYITNQHIDLMAKRVKAYWPEAKTSVRASPRTLSSYGRQEPNWQYLDLAFVMINYKKWSKNGVIRTIDGFLRREVNEAKKQNLGIIGSIQMLIGAPQGTKWWNETSLGNPAPVGKLAVSPQELITYFNHFTKRKNVFGFERPLGSRLTDTVFVFRWDRNEENDWEDKHYKESIDFLIGQSSGE